MVYKDANYLADYRRSIHVAEESKETEEKLIKAWQFKLNRVEEGRLTYNLISDIESWYKRYHGLIDFTLT